MGKLKEFTDKVWYGTGAVGLDLSYGMFNGRLSKYLTDVLHLNTNFLLGLTAAARIWDGVNDPMMGSIVDNTNTKFGRYRPWVVIGSTLNAVVLFLLFFNPGFNTETPSLWLYAYIAVMYILWGMTNTTADIPYWSMVPSFTTDPNERSIIATIARAFSGLGQGIVQIGSPIILDALGRAVINSEGETTTVWTQSGYTVTAVVCSVCLVLFSVVSMSRVRENVAVAPAEKFSFKKIFSVIKENDQLRVFMLFAMLSNAGFYTTTGVLDYFFAAVMENTKAQSTFSLFGTVGSILGLAVIPVMMKFTSRRRTYQFSLFTALFGYIGMFVSGQFLVNTMLLNIFYTVTQIGTASMFISQTVFLADVVDYGEVKMGVRRESVTFSMKGFLQKMAYTAQTVILFTALGISGYNSLTPDSMGNIVYTKSVKRAISSVMYVIPPIFFALSILVFTTKFKLHGEYMEDITKKVEEARQKRLVLANEKAETVNE
ncbi:MAG: MFS transporter [Clostridia bacterium]|nr:MFS transporter [Clostridia bacterium]